MNKKNFKKTVLPYIMLGLLMLIIFYVFNLMNTKVNKLSYNEFMQSISEGKISEVEVTPSNDGGVYYLEGKLKSYKENESFEDIEKMALLLVIQKTKKLIFG